MRQQKLLRRARQRRGIDQNSAKIPVSKGGGCRVLGQHRLTQRKVPRRADDEVALTEGIIVFARQCCHYRYRVVTTFLGYAGWHVNRKWVMRIWPREQLKMS